MIVCPCCGSALAANKAPLASLTSAPLSNSQRIIVDALVHAYPRVLSTDYLVDCLYGDDPAGGPDDAAHTLGMFIVTLRKQLPKHGWTVPRAKAGAYRLAPLKESA